MGDRVAKGAVVPWDGGSSPRGRVRDRVVKVAVVVLGLVGAITLIVFLIPSKAAFRVGVVAGTSGQAQAVRQGLVLAQNDLQQEWDGEPPLELVFRDPEGSAQTAHERLVGLRDEGVTLIAGVVGSDLARGCLVPVREGRVVVVSASDDLGLSRAMGKNWFQVGPARGPEGLELARWGRERRLQWPMVLHAPTARGRDLAASLSSRWGGLAERLILEIEGEAQITWIQGQVDELSVDGLFLFLSPELSGRIVGSVKREGLLFFGTDQLGTEAFRKAAGDADLTKVRFLRPAEEESASPRREQVLASWREEFGDATAEPDPAVYAAYDALQVLARAGRTAEWMPGKDLVRVLNVVRATSFQGATGAIAFDGEGLRTLSPFRRCAYAAKGVEVPYAPGKSGK